MSDSGRLTGSRASMEPASGLHPSGFDPERIAAQLAHTIREEQVRQYRDDERGKCPGGADFYEEHVGPYQIALVILKSLETASADTDLVKRLRAAARNVELARERASVGYLAGWEHLAMEEAAIAMEARQRRDAEERPDPKDDSAGRRHRPNTPSLQTPQGGDS